MIHLNWPPERTGRLTPVQQLAILQMLDRSCPSSGKGVHPEGLDPQQHNDNAAWLAAAAAAEEMERNRNA